jgi:hypothetical protein
LVLAAWPGASSLGQAPVAQPAERRVFHYEPEAAEVAGTLEQQTFAGPPGYESIANGDEVLRYWFLRLRSPVDVVATNPKDPVNGVAERRVKILQLVLKSSDNAAWAALNAAKPGDRAAVKGTLFHQQTGHHFTRVLISVDSLAVTKDP